MTGPFTTAPPRGRSRDVADSEQVSGRRVLAALGCGAFVIGAVLLEMLSGQGANSPITSRFESAVPLGWPAPLRVLWWLAVAAAAVAHRALLHPSRNLRNRVLATAVASPFVAFAVGIGVGADWATWH